MLTFTDRYPFAAGSLTDTAGAAELSGRYPQYRAALEWIRGFITRPDARIGRAGAVCPRVAPALTRNLIMLVAIPVTASSVTEAAEKGIRLAGLYRELFPSADRFRAGALLAFFPGLDPQRAGRFIDGGHRALRMQFVHGGLMLGEFHPASTVAAVRHPGFTVMRCPVPMFAVRAITVHDLMFLDRPATPDPVLVPYFRHYLRHAGPQAGAATRTALQARIAAAGAAS